MPIPLIAVAVFELTLAAIALYEIGELSKEIYEGYQKYGKDIDKAKDEIRKLIQSLQDEIAQKIDEKQEVVFLLAAQKADAQGQLTRKAQGRGADGATISAAIQQKIPFRKVISMVCEKADHMPLIQLRRKKGVELKDLPKIKRKLLEELLAMTLEELADIDLEKFLVIRLKQLAANLMFEFVDECLGWASPLKCEESFGAPPGYADHPVEGTSRLVREGRINPFYPGPYQRQRGSVSADLVIQEYRHHRPDKDNIFAIVEIKFEGDRIEAKQFDGYIELLKHAAIVKTARSPVRYQNKPVSSGGRLSLFRYPEDKAAERTNKEPQGNPKQRKGKGRTGH